MIGTTVIEAGGSPTEARVAADEAMEHLNLELRAEAIAALPASEGWTATPSYSAAESTAEDAWQQDAPFPTLLGSLFGSQGAFADSCTP